MPPIRHPLSGSSNPASASSANRENRPIHGIALAVRDSQQSHSPVTPVTIVVQPGTEEEKDVFVEAKHTVPPRPTSSPTDGWTVTRIVPTPQSIHDTRREERRELGFGIATSLAGLLLSGAGAYATSNLLADLSQEPPHNTPDIVANGTVMAVLFPFSAIGMALSVKCLRKWQQLRANRLNQAAQALPAP